MSEENVAQLDTSAPVLAAKSWTAYVGPFVFAIVLLLIVVPLAWRASQIAGVVALVLALAYLTLRVLSLRVVRLYMDEHGIWLYSGLFPWSRGISGVKWRDLDEALYVTGFKSWLFKSYTVRIGHRYTKSSEIVLHNMTRGDQAVATINERHQSLVANNLLAW